MSLLFFIPIMLALYDLMMVFVGYNVNQSACRDAARAAATVGTGPGRTGTFTLSPADPPYRKAEDIIERANKRSGENNPIVGPNLERVTATVLVAPRLNFGGSYEGTVTVATSARVILPVRLPDFIPAPQFVDISAQNTFPITATEETNLPAVQQAQGG